MISSKQYADSSIRRHFIGQEAEYTSFLPGKINREFEVTNRINERAEEAVRLIGELNAYSLLVPGVDFFISMHVRKEAVQSSKMEGTKTEMAEAVLSEEDVPPEKRDDWREVQNYISALNYSTKRLNDLPLSMRLLNESHGILLQGARGKDKTPGKIRTRQNWVDGAILRTANFIPPHVDDLPELLSDMQRFWHNREFAMSKLIRIAVTHYQFETIHPYADGNGRIGRLLIMLQLMDYGLMSKPTLYVSDYLEAHRRMYVDRLMGVRQNNELDGWLQFFLEGIVASATSSREKFEKIMHLRESYTDRLLGLGRRAKNADALVKHLYKNPVINSVTAAEGLGVSNTNTILLLNELVESGILRELTGFSRNRLYRLEEYFQIFQ